MDKPAKTQAKRRKKPGRPTLARNRGKTEAEKKRDYRSRKKEAADFEPVFAASLALIEGGAKHAEMLTKIGLSWPEYWPRVKNDAELRRRYMEAVETRDELWRATAEEKLFDRAINGYIEDASTPKGIVVPLRKTDGNALIRLYNDRHVPKQATALSGSLDINAALADAVHAADNAPASPVPSPASP